jgi:transcription initiation factor TFIID subunit 6
MNTKMSPGARSTLVSLVESHVTNLLTQALSVARHSKRARVVVPHSVREDEGEEAEGDVAAGGAGATGDGGGIDDGDEYGIGDMDKSSKNRPYMRRRIHAADVNMALQLMGSEKLYSTCAGQVPYNATASSLEGSGGATSQRKVVLADFLRDETLGNPPRELGIRQHWLAVDGTQPLVAENPASAGEIMVTAAVGADAPHFSASTEEPGGGRAGEEDATGSLLQVNQLRSGLLSEELLLYYTRVTSTLKRSDRPDQQDLVLARLANDAGLQELVPFLVRHCQRELYRSVASSEFDLASSMVHLARAMLSNSNLHLELHLHELLPALVTCVVSQTPTASSSRSSSVSCWSLKQDAADTLATACDLYGDEYATLRSRVLKALCRAASADRHLTSRYGGIVGIAALGHRAISAFLVEPSMEWFADFDSALEADGQPSGSSDATAKNFQLSDADLCGVQMCQGAILDAAGKVLRRLCDKEITNDIGSNGDDDSLVAVATQMRNLQCVLGDKWVAFGCCDDGYAECFI